jgi:hypothetical protein
MRHQKQGARILPQIFRYSAARARAPDLIQSDRRSNAFEQVAADGNA